MGLNRFLTTKDFKFLVGMRLESIPEEFPYKIVEESLTTGKETDMIVVKTENGIIIEVISFD